MEGGTATFCLQIWKQRLKDFALSCTEHMRANRYIRNRGWEEQYGEGGKWP